MDNECWELDERSMTLDLMDDEHSYYIELSRCNSSGEILDWIVQISKKSWATDNIIASLVRMFDHYLDCQSNLCSFGMDNKIFNAIKCVKSGQYKVWEDLDQKLQKQATG